MTRISLINTEPIRLQQLQFPTGGGVGQLSPGDVLTAQVVRNLGAGRFLLNLQGNSLVATSSSPLTTGQQLSLQVSANKDGQASLHVLTLSDGAIAESAGKPTIGSLDARPSSLFTDISTSRGRDSIPQTDADTTLPGRTAVPEQIPDRVAALIRNDGPLQRLLSARPDLAPRVEQLVRQILDRPQGLAQNLTDLQGELSTLVQRLPASQQPAIASSQSRLTAQLFPADLLEQPEQLAQNLVSRFESLAKGLESSIAKSLPEMGNGLATQQTTANQASVPNQSTANEANLDAQRLLDGSVADPSKVPVRTESEVSAPARDTSSLIQRTFEGDLKGQLLELRTQLTQLSEQNQGNTTNIQNAIARTDVLLDQVTAQQVRNLDGLNQFAYAEIPIDPKTGIKEARLQVFYRNRNRGNGNSQEEVDRFTIALFLNMSQLGDVMTVVSSIESSLSVAFTVDNDAAETLIGDHSDDLRNALSYAGHMGATVTIRRSAPPTALDVGEAWEEFLSLPVPPSDRGGLLNSEA